MSTQDDVQFLVNEFDAKADELAAIVRSLGNAIKGWESYHAIHFSNGEILSKNLFHDKGAGLEALIGKLAPHVTKWH